MQPGDKTRAPLLTGELDQAGLFRELRLTVVFHPDTARIGASVRLGVEDTSGALRLDATIIGRNAPLFDDGLGLCEQHISRKALKLKHHARGLELADISSTSRTQLGCDKAAAMSLSFRELESGVGARFGHAVVCWLRLAHYPIAESNNPLSDYVGVSPEAARVRNLIRVAATSDLPVLLRGESGVGKEVAARAIHGASNRSSKALVSVNMAALPETLADVELFGSAKGAFTGAERRPGYFGEAHKGTLFLDEIGDLPLAVQPKLLRALQSGEIQVVGGKSTTVDVRIIAASDADLDDKSRFKHALFQRLAGITIELAPLKARREDLGVLLCVALGGNASFASLNESPNQTAAWAGFIFDGLYADWPGNVREFLLSAQRFLLTLDDRSRQRVPQYRQPASPASPNKAEPSDAEIAAMHEASHFEIAETARRLGMSRGSLYRRAEHIPGFQLAAKLPDRAFVAAMNEVGNDLDALSRLLRISRASIAQRLRNLEARS